MTRVFFAAEIYTTLAVFLFTTLVVFLMLDSNKSGTKLGFHQLDTYLESHDFLAEKTVFEKLANVNSFVNNHFDAESKTMAMAKFILLTEAGIESDRFRIIYSVKESINRPYVILGYYTDDKTLLIMEAMVNKIRKVDNRLEELKAVYFFSAEKFTQKQIQFNQLEKRIALSSS